MKHVIKIITVSGLLIVALIACSNNNDTHNNDTKDDDRGLQEVINHMEEEGIRMTDAEEPDDDEADESVQLFINDGDMYLYKYDPDADALAEAEGDDNAVVNGVFVMDDIDVPDDIEDIVIDAFESF